MLLRLVFVSAMFVFVSGCSGSSSSPADTPLPPTAPSPPPSPPAPGAQSSVTIVRGAESLGNRAYSPDELIVAAGTTVTWVNADSESHTSTSDSPGWNSGSVRAGGQFSFVFNTLGRFPYHCSIHPGMVGAIVVR